MSQWTHVAGLIRVDRLHFLGGDIVGDLVMRLGVPVQYGSSQREWNAVYEVAIIPIGSEGSIQYRIQQTGDKSSASWGVVYIWGDLRDYEDVSEIYEWLKRACDGLWIRSCCVKVDVEYQASYLISDGKDGLRLQRLEDVAI